MKGEVLPPFGAIIPCAGKGMRFREITKDNRPKSLQHIGRRRLIEHALDPIKPELVRNLVFVVGHHGEAIRDWVTNARLRHRKVQFAPQIKQGYLGAVIAGLGHIVEDDFTISNADEILVGLDPEEAIRYHLASGRPATVVAAYKNHLYRERILTIGRDNIILRTELRPKRYFHQTETIGLVNTGFLILNKEAIQYIDPDYSTEFSGIMDPLVEARKIGAFIKKGLAYINVGTPEEYFEALRFLRVSS